MVLAGPVGRGGEWRDPAGVEPYVNAFPCPTGVANYWNVPKWGRRGDCKMAITAPGSTPFAYLCATEFPRRSGPLRRSSALTQKSTADISETMRLDDPGGVVESVHSNPDEGKPACE